LLEEVIFDIYRALNIDRLIGALIDLSQKVFDELLVAFAAALHTAKLETPQ
jgi:hypothetical protein